MKSLLKISFIVALLTVCMGSHTSASDAVIEFDLTDQPGKWFQSKAGPIGGSQSLGVGHPNVEVKFSGRSHTVHTTVLAIPVVYNGWVQNLPKEWKDKLTPGQQNPFP